MISTARIYGKAFPFPTAKPMNLFWKFFRYFPAPRDIYNARRTRTACSSAVLLATPSGLQGPGRPSDISAELPRAHPDMIRKASGSSFPEPYIMINGAGAW